MIVVKFIHQWLKKSKVLATDQEIEETTTTATSAAKQILIIMLTGYI